MRLGRFMRSEDLGIKKALTIGQSFLAPLPWRGGGEA
jgi:hypothetical protein